MFGMGLGEILLVAVIAIIFLGPDKLPGAMVEIAKFFRQAKRGIHEAKDTLEKEIHMDEIKKHTDEYKNMLDNATEEITSIGNMELPTGASEKKEPTPEAAKKETPKITPKDGEISD